MKKKASCKIHPNLHLGNYRFESSQACTLRPLKSKMSSKRWLSGAEEGVLQDEVFYSSFQLQVPKSQLCKTFKSFQTLWELLDAQHHQRDTNY